MPLGWKTKKQREAHTRGKPLNLSPGLASDTLRHDANRQRQGQIEMNVPLRIGNGNARFSQLPIDCVAQFAVNAASHHVWSEFNPINKDHQQSAIGKVFKKHFGGWHFQDVLMIERSIQQQLLSRAGISLISDTNA